MVFRKFWEYVEKSTLGGVSNKVSTTRISSYLILGSILATGFVYLLIDIINAIIKWHKGEVFIISTEDLIFFGMFFNYHFNTCMQNFIKPNIKSMILCINSG